MIEILQPLSDIPGVRYAGIVTSDGVPILLPGAGGTLGGEDGQLGLSLDINMLAAFAYQWYEDLGQLTEELTWDRSNRVVLKAARGTLVARAVSRGVLIALLEPGVGAESLRLPMEGAAARIDRNLRSMGGQIEGPLPSAPVAQPVATAESDTDSTSEETDQ